MEYKLPEQKKKVIEFVASHSIEHEPNELLANYNRNHTDLLPYYEEQLARLFQDEFPDIAIQNICNRISYSYTNNLSDDINLILNSNTLNFILPYANIETEYSLLNKTLNILKMLSSFEQNDDSPFQNPQFAQNILIIIEKSEYPTIRKVCLKIIINLIDDDTIGTIIFTNFIHFKIPSVILSSKIIEPDTFDRLMNVNKQYYKVVARTAKLLGMLASRCKENHLLIFAPFFDIIIFYITHDFTKFDINETILENFLYLLSYMMALDSNRRYAYSNQIPEYIISKIIYRKKGIFIQYSYDIIFQIAANDGLYPIFQSTTFYNVTLSSIQEAKSVDVLSSIFRAIGAIIPHDYKNLWGNDIMSLVYDILNFDKYKFKLEALMLYLRFFEVSCNDPTFCLNVLRTNNALTLICLSIDFLSQEQVMYFIYVIKCLTNERFCNLRNEVLKNEDVFEVFQSLSSNENEEIARSADDMLGLWNH